MGGETEVVETRYHVLAPIPGEHERISKTERTVFWLLKNANGRIVTHSTIWNHLYSLRPDCDCPDDQMTKVYICKLRKKLKAHKIVSHRDIGYSMEPLA
jgi:DNA-binding response OmpR family regulator